MTDQERARALSGATRECPDCEGRRELRTGKRDMWSGSHETEGCTKCGGTGRVFVLGERARKACPYNGMVYTPGRGFTMQAITQYQAAHNRGKCPCNGDGWLSTLLLPDGRWDIDLLIDLLEELGYELIYDTVSGGYPLGLVIGTRWQIYTRGGDVPLTQNAILAVAACEALNLGAA